MKPMARTIAAALPGATSLFGAAVLLAVLGGCATDHGDPEPVAAAAAPLSWKAQQALLPQDGHSPASFGHSVAMSGDTLAVAAPFAVAYDGGWGTIDVFVRSGQSWTKEAHLAAGEGAKNESFGMSVAASGDTIVAGAPGDDVNGVFSGSAYVFVRSGQTWKLQKKLLPYDGAPNADFGRSVAISGDTVVVGARYLQGEGKGSAYVFVRSDQTWIQQAKLVDDDGAEGDLMGFSVAVSGDTAVVGAIRNSDKAVDAGAACVFVRSGQTWALQQKLYAPDGAAGDRFGYSVALSGSTAVVTSIDDDGAGPAWSGSAYVFARSGVTWSLEQKLVADDAGAGDNFGWSAALSGNTLVVGAPNDRDEDGLDSGSAYVFARSGQTWAKEDKLLHPAGPSTDFFGGSVGVSENIITVGVPYDDVVGPDSGAAYIFVGRQDDGKPCSDAGECASGFCADDVCCESACDEAGEACSAEKKGSGADGVCGPIQGVGGTGGGGGAGSTGGGGSATGGGGGSSGSTTGGAAQPETSYYGCQAAPGSRPAHLVVVVTLAALAARARRRRMASVEGGRGSRGPSVARHSGGVV